MKGTIRSIGGHDDVFYIGTLNGTIYAYAAEPGKKLRTAVGLEPIAEYLKHFGVTYVPPKKR